VIITGFYFKIFHYQVFSKYTFVASVLLVWDEKKLLCVASNAPIVAALDDSLQRRREVQSACT
jgi:hypothetical protein